jgi:hypothetical protein
MRTATLSLFISLASCGTGSSIPVPIGDPPVDTDTDTDADADADTDTDADSDTDTDSDTDSDTALPLPDLVPTEITRDGYYYRVRFCNEGGPTTERFLIGIEDTVTGERFLSNPLYPHDVPAPGDCQTTGGFTCGLIGDSGCDGPTVVLATVDTENTVTESNEANNEMTVPF